MDDMQGAQPTVTAGADEATTLTDEEIETRTVGSAPSASLDDDTDTGDADDTGDDAGDDSDTGDAGDDSDTGDVGDDSGDDSDDSDA